MINITRRFFEWLKNLKNITDKIKKEIEPEKIILFGSKARKDNLKYSDYDIIIVSKKFKGMDFHKRIISIYEIIDEAIPIDVLCYTPEEFEKKRKEIGIVKKKAWERNYIVTLKTDRANF